MPPSGGAYSPDVRAPFRDQRAALPAQPRPELLLRQPGPPCGPGSAAPRARRAQRLRGHQRRDRRGQDHADAHAAGRDRLHRAGRRPVLSTQLEADDLRRAVALSFGIRVDSAAPDDVERALQSFLLALAKDGRRAVLIVDEAQNLDRSAFHWLLSLEKGHSPTRIPMKVCLIGQPELRDIVNSGDHIELRARVAVQCHLGPLGPGETGAYIRHRLERVGWKGSPSFEPSAFEEIHRWTGGIPRRINLLCNRLMLSRFLGDSMRIDAASVEQTATDLRAEIGDSSPVPPPVPTAAAALPVLREEVAAPPVVAPAPAAAVPAAKPGVDVELDVDVEPVSDRPQPAMPALRRGANPGRCCAWSAGRASTSRPRR
ncbi:AAA family ATPase [Piscinibacter aquaticus]|uniref:AAA family ATPase n=1 Tax=Piscinibacter aquaticus TaxID=392597 RepID=A0A5C6U0Y0_9BURK|nr:AAA family ATPase [Piscinibacter aquaticus]